MKKILEFGLVIFCWMNTALCFAAEKFEILPDLPDPLACAVQPAAASTVSGGAGNTILNNQTIGHEPSIISAVFSLLIVLVLIYLTGIIYVKLNKFGFNTLKKQQGIFSKSQVSVVSTTSLGNNKSLHVVELDGKRMLIGASSGAIQLIKDLGNIDKDENVEGEYSSIEIPTIKIPKIEIPKIEIPTVNFSKLATKIHKGIEKYEEEPVKEESQEQNPAEREYENQEGIIDSLFAGQGQVQEEETDTTPSVDEHKVNPEEYALYKKYL